MRVTRVGKELWQTRDMTAVEEGEKRMAEGERATGTPNTIYDLSSVLFHALEGGASYDTYIEDAEREGDEELTEFFRRVREEDRDRAAEARLLIAERTSLASGQEGSPPRRRRCRRSGRERSRWRKRFRPRGP